MTAKFEARHLELRETLAQRGAAWREGEEDGAEVIDASRRLDAFHERTAPLVDDLAAAARRLAGGMGTLELSRALDALDEVAARG